MNVVSDPSLRSVSSKARGANAPWTDARERNALVGNDATALPAPRPTVQRLLARGVVVAGVALLGLRAIGGWLAEPLTEFVPNAPTWNVELTSRSTSSVLAFAYSRESGMHLLRVPGRGSQAPRVIPAKLASGELHLVSLSFSGLHVSADGPPDSGVLKLSADARVITVYQDPGSSGVRAGW